MARYISFEETNVFVIEKGRITASSARIASIFAEVFYSKYIKICLKKYIQKLIKKLLSDL
jgi:hypothetical protein